MAEAVTWKTADGTNIKYDTEGVLYCNTVKYNYKQCRNIVADNNGDQLSGIWNLGGNAASIDNPNGYKAYRCWRFGSGGSSMLTQSCFQPTQNHKYYGGCMWKTDSGFSSGDARFEWFLNDNANGKLTFAQHQNQNTNGQWVRTSSIQTMTVAPASGTWIIRCFVSSGRTNSYVSKFIIIDLTDTFGTGNEPTKEWCDENILEWEMMVNTGTVSGTTITSGNISSYFDGSTFAGWWPQNYLAWNTNWAPRDYFYSFNTNGSNYESIATSRSAYGLVKNKHYYAFIETALADVSKFVDGMDNQIYFPVAEPVMGTTPIVQNFEYNGGGGMSSWKRASFFAFRNNWNSGNYQFRIDYDTNYRNLNFWFTNVTLINVEDSLNFYNKMTGENLTINDVNKEWCDRWQAGRGNPIIHIKDPHNTAIRFSTNYDIVCNDIEIHPEMQTITFDKTGTIKCRALVKAKEY